MISLEIFFLITYQEKKSQCSWSQVTQMEKTFMTKNLDNNIPSYKILFKSTKERKNENNKKETILGF